MKLSIFSKISAPVILILFILIIILGYKYQQEKKADYLKGGNIVYKSKDVLGISINELNITVDYNNKVTDGSIKVFGGLHGPRLEHTDAWDKLSEVGVTLVRHDLFIDQILPSNITLEDYKKNKNNIQNPINWKQNEINDRKKFYQNVKDRNMYVMAIASYAPKWLTHSNSIYGVPKDWNVFEDLVSKTYELFRKEIDFIEIWNEPNYPFFLNLDSSGLNREDAYYLIYFHAAKAIRKVDLKYNDGKITPIGGPALSNPSETSQIEKIISTSDTKNLVDFISYHNYEHVSEPSWLQIKSVLQKHSLDHLPIYITEWAYSPKIKVNNPYDTGTLSIPYTGTKLINYLSNGIEGAAHSMLQQIEPNSAYGNVGYLGFYYWKNNQADLLPKSKTWRLLSKKMKLGMGPSSIYKIDNNNFPAIAFRNYKDEYGMAFSNESSSAVLLNININNLDNVKAIKVDAYVASNNYDASEVVGSNSVKKNKDSFLFRIYIPSESVVGLLFH